jgi:two-component system NtrC family response regulator
MKLILIVEDDQDIQTQLKWGLSKDYEILQASNRADAVKLFNASSPTVVTLDLGLPPYENDSSEGLLLLNEIIKKEPSTKVIVLTGNDESETAVKAVSSGAYDYYKKPIEIEELKIIIKRAFHLAEIEAENRTLHRLMEKKAGFAGMIGQSPGMLDVFDKIRKVATTDAAVLITGESGTGKELVARAIHEKSLRKGGPFIPINCGAIPENLLESELFGYEKGAFTGAYSRQIGKFELATGGTLFLDEIGELSKSLQAKLLRFLQERTIQRVGGRKDIPIDARIISATNIDIKSAISEGKFREDLYYRISVLSIDIPPLRSRGADIRLLAGAFLERYRTSFHKKMKGFSKAAIEAMENHSWPGNVRELENRLQRAVITASSGYIEPADLDLDNDSADEEKMPRSRYFGIPLRDARRRLEMDIIVDAMNRHNGNIKRASEELGISRPTLYDLIEKYEIDLSDKSKRKDSPATG